MNETARCTHDKSGVCELEKRFMQCKTEVGQQVESLNDKFEEFEERLSKALEIIEAMEGFSKVVGWFGDKLVQGGKFILIWINH